MTQRMRLILCSAGSFVFGALLMGVLAYAAAVRSLHDYSRFPTTSRRRTPSSKPTSYAACVQVTWHA